MKKLEKSDFGLTFVNFEPATLKEWETGWQIEYRVLNPITRKLEKFRIRLEKIRKRLGSDSKTRKHAKKYCDAINQKLEDGWNPYTEERNGKTFQPLTTALNSFLNNKEQDMRNNVFREDSLRSYRSQIDRLNAWLKSVRKNEITVVQFTRELANDYMDDIYLVKKHTSRTFNNNLRNLRTIWNWLIEKEYCKENPFQKIKVKKEATKLRVIIPPEWRLKIVEYCREVIPSFEIVCLLVYNSFMRPAEICRTQIKDIHLDKNGIYLEGTKTKNGNPRWCLLTPELKQKIQELNIENYSPDFYLFSDKLVPGSVQKNTRDIDRYFSRMRVAIEMPKEIQLYSFRDTAITDMKKSGMNNYFISKISGHLNSDEIETYTHEPDPQALQYIMLKAKNFINF